MTSTGALVAAFNLCLFGTKFYKRSWFVGLRPGLDSLPRDCVCPNMRAHEKVGGDPGEVKPARVFPSELEVECAKLVGDAWGKNLATSWRGLGDVRPRWKLGVVPRWMLVPSVLLRVG